jgi:hypothetical protein
MKTNVPDSFFHQTNLSSIVNQGVSANTVYIKNSENLNQKFNPGDCAPQRDFICRCIENAHCISGEVIPIEFKFSGITESENECCNDPCAGENMEVVTVLDKKNAILKCMNSNSVQYFGCFEDNSKDTCVTIPIRGVLRVRILPKRDDCECDDDDDDSGPFILACYDFSDQFPGLNITREEIKNNCNPRVKERTTRTISFDAITPDNQKKIPMVITLCRYADTKKGQLCYQLTHVSFRIHLYEDDNNASPVLSQLCRNKFDTPVFRNTQIVNVDGSSRGLLSSSSSSSVPVKTLQDQFKECYSSGKQFVRVYQSNRKIFGCNQYPDDSTCHLICPTSLMVNQIYNVMKQEYNNPILLNKDFHDPNYLAKILECHYRQVYEILQTKKYMVKSLSLATLANGMHGLPTDFYYHPNGLDHQEHFQAMIHPEHAKSYQRGASFKDRVTAQFTPEHALPDGKIWRNFLQNDANVQQKGHVIPNIKSNVADLIIQMVYYQFCTPSSTSTQQQPLDHWKNIVNILSKAETGNIAHSLDGTFRLSDPIEDQRGRLGITELGWRVQPVTQNLDCRYLRCKSNEYSLWCVKIGEWTGVLGCSRDDPTRKTIVKDFCDVLLSSSLSSPSPNCENKSPKWTGSGISVAHYPPPDHEFQMGNNGDDDDDDDQSDSDDDDDQPDGDDDNQPGESTRDAYFDRFYDETLISSVNNQKTTSNSPGVGNDTNNNGWDETIKIILAKLVKDKTKFVTVEDESDPDKHAKVYFTEEKSNLTDDLSITSNYIAHVEDKSGIVELRIPFSNKMNGESPKVHLVNDPTVHVPFSIQLVYMNAESTQTSFLVRMGTTMIVFPEENIAEIRKLAKDAIAGATTQEKPTSAGFGIGLNFGNGGGGYGYGYGGHRRHYHYRPTRPRGLLNYFLSPGYYNPYSYYPGNYYSGGYYSGGW